MNQDIQQKIKEKYDVLPDDIKQAISNVDFGEKISEIAKKNNLLIDQADSLYTEVFLATLGVEPIADFSKNISENIGISTAVANAIAQDVNGRIFLPIRESLQKIQVPEEETEVPVNSERESILHDIEHPQPTPERGTPITDTARELEMKSSTESFVGAKMTAPSISTAESSTIQVPPAPAEKKYAADPYREPIN